MDKKNYSTRWLAVGGGTLIGVGVGIIYIKENPLILPGAILVGIGVGLIIESIIGK